MLILGIESSCDETSAAVVRIDGKERVVLSNIIASQIDTHRLYGGVVPEIASRAHIEAISSITARALEEAELNLSDIELIGVTAAPGLIGALLVGVNFAKSLAYANNIPLVGINHIRAHVAAAYLAYPDLEPPALALVVSGGHSAIYDIKTPVDFTEIGSTRDDAVGEAFDKVGRLLGLPYPAGAAFDRLANEGDETAVSLPSPAIGGQNLDFSFSGLKTAAVNYLHTCEQRGIVPDRGDLAASFTKSVVEAFAQKLEGALRLTGHKRLIVAGGVAANSHLRRRLYTLCELMQVKLYIPPLSLCGDNAAMVAAQAYYEYLSGKRDGTDLNASATV
ncbi:MAG: tRNA (adenosine(37)-N6)-threonylcarbamoyltransferase complex transferase subunit TsaD [Clostridiales bacterium]|nr:tRNA (adenosine(37)-N6)-threonylcarbamoyltransferase complex transferase subunit TsaD [Clostridiales bacterium]